jgi:outer membrane translocation and assembly module TamA
LFNSRFFLNFRTIQRNYAEEDYFGIGPSSDLAHRSNFRFDATDVGSTVGLYLSRGLRFQIFGGLLNSSIGPGQDKQLPSVEQVFRSEQAPGLQQEPDYRYGGAALDFDYRDDPVNTTAGGYYRIGWTSFNDSKLSRFSFRQYATELRQYVPVFDSSRVLALRALSLLTDSNASNQIPFFMMGALGGAESLRGFADARFRDRNLLLLNAEYRWTVFTQMDAVLFADAGKVFSKINQIGLNNLETSYGFGARFKSPKGPLVRVEFAFSHEMRRVGIVFVPAF